MRRLFPRVTRQGWGRCGSPLLIGLAALVAGCGGDSDVPDFGPGWGYSCRAGEELQWLRNTMNDRYFWAGRSPDPSPDAFRDVYRYLDARRFTGSATESADQFSYIEDARAYEEFYVEGRTVSHGVSMNLLEGKAPLKVRYVDPGSPAELAGVRRGDTIVSINGVSASQLLTTGDLTAAGDQSNWVFDRGAERITQRLVSKAYDLVPVTGTSVFTLPNGKKVGYLSLKDFVTQAESPLTQAVARFRAEEASELILDLRYNGGGRVSTANHLASLVAGATHAGKVFAQLSYNPQKQALNETFRLDRVSAATGFSRVVVLTGTRTCSASELVANGLKPYADVVVIGSESCGKPVGSVPEQCGSQVYALVNFEVLNARGEGRYYKGLPLTCRVNDDFNGALGSASETMTAAALSYLENGACPAVPMSVPSMGRLAGPEPRKTEPGWRSVMIKD